MNTKTNLDILTSVKSSMLEMLGMKEWFEKKYEELNYYFLHNLHKVTNDTYLLFTDSEVEKAFQSTDVDKLFYKYISNILFTMHTKTSQFLFQKKLRKSEFRNMFSLMEELIVPAPYEIDARIEFLTNHPDKVVVVYPDAFDESDDNKSAIDYLFQFQGDLHGLLWFYEKSTSDDNIPSAYSVIKFYELTDKLHDSLYQTALKTTLDDKEWNILSMYEKGVRQATRTLMKLKKIHRATLFTGIGIISDNSEFIDKYVSRLIKKYKNN